MQGCGNPVTFICFTLLKQLQGCCNPVATGFYRYEKSKDVAAFWQPFCYPFNKAQGCGILVSTIFYLSKKCKTVATLWQPFFLPSKKKCKAVATLWQRSFILLKKVQGCVNLVATVLLTFLKNARLWQPYGNRSSLPF